MPRNKKKESLQLNLFGEETRSAHLDSDVHDLDETLKKHLKAGDVRSARHAARKQEELLKQLIQEKRARKTGGRSSL